LTANNDVAISFLPQNIGGYNIYQWGRIFACRDSSFIQQNAGEGPGLLRGFSEVPGSGKFIFLSELFGFKKPGPSARSLCVRTMRL